MEPIYIPRGTCQAITMNLTENGEPLTMGENDYLVLTVREIASESSPILLQVKGQEGKNVIGLHESDTDLPAGKYSADIRFYRKLDAGYCTFSVWGISESDTREKNLKNFIILTAVGEQND